MAELAAAQGLAGSPTVPAGMRSARPMAQAGKVAEPAEKMPLEAPTAVNMADRAAGVAALGAQAAPVPEARGRTAAVYRPWTPWAARKLGTALSDYVPVASSRRSTSGRVSSAAAAEENRIADIVQVAPVRTDKAADRAAGTVAERMRGLAVAVCGPSASARPEGPAAPRIAAAELLPEVPAPGRVPPTAAETPGEVPRANGR